MGALPKAAAGGKSAEKKKRRVTESEFGDAIVAATT